MSQLNIDVFRLINDLGKDYEFLNPVIFFLAKYTLYVLCLGLVVYWLTRTRENRLMVLNGMLAFVVAEVLGKVSGLLYSHNQPFAVLADVNQLVAHEIDNSFPSDHTILFFAISISIWLVRKREGRLWLLLAMVVGVSRIWAGVHYPVDILVATVYGMGAALIVHWASPRHAFFGKMLSFYEKQEGALLPRANRQAQGFLI
ncbi:undecaprenyl-diphosphatase [Neobacillus niacini]|uniref:undecaprenyl-diphosphatase n=1 Tax=Neobacillus niacini TaxID=86668 RepID=UPI0021CAFF7E|nr:undecaprenyl-diphosphatase [Neobacillus niacini]MCM3765795.1 undecaprenyl-diphosphatase [Neobacillus niacini]